MKLTVLSENSAGPGFLAEHGLSYLIESKGVKLIFDAGASDVFLENARRLQLSIDAEIDIIVLSHGHWDHGNGLQFTGGKKLIAHPAAFSERFRKKDGKYIGLALSRTEITQKFNLTETREPLKISENMYFLGEIPRVNSFESQYTGYVDASGNDDFVPDDTALALVENNRLIVITGCSHSGICNICEHARRVTGIQNIQMVIGGFHLKERNLTTQKTIEYFRENDIERIYPSHCTALPALSVLFEEFRFDQVRTGMTFQF